MSLSFSLFSLQQLFTGADEISLRDIVDVRDSFSLMSHFIDCQPDDWLIGSALFHCLISWALMKQVGYITFFYVCLIVLV